MKVTPQVPPEIQSLIAEGLWPADKTSAQKQNLKPLISPESIQRFAPDESRIYFYPPPFATVRMVMDQEQSFWSDPRAMIGEIDPDQTVLIGDFGLGSDAPIALDYRRDTQNPSVIRLRWATDGNHWVQAAPDLATFATFLKR